MYQIAKNQKAETIEFFTHLSICFPLAKYGVQIMTALKEANKIQIKALTFLCIVCLFKLFSQNISFKTDRI
jgi:hypothetical protein